MKLDDYNDYDGYDQGSTFLKTFMGVTLIILLILIVLLLANKDQIMQRVSAKNTVETRTEEEEKRIQEKMYVESLLSEEKQTSMDLEFWSMYDARQNENDTETLESQETTDVAETIETAETKEMDPSKDGLHTRIVYQDGTDEWVEINEYLKKNTYDIQGLVLNRNLMKYYVNSEAKSFVGASLSKADGEINFYQLKREGVDYCMLRIGQRGYQKGEISLDDQFEENLKGAIETEMPIGITFATQAITKEEAVEEAQFIIENLQKFREKYEFTLQYPVVLCLEPVYTDQARNKDLDRNERTLIVDTVLKAIKEAGYTPMVQANKEWLIKKLYLSHMEDYDIWLDQPGDVFDYPYQFVMWEYSNTAELNGTKNAIALSISFVDYSLR